jgi:hypothetical protein
MIIKEVLAQQHSTGTKPINIGAQFGLAYGSLGEFVSLLIPLAFFIASMMVVFYFLIGAFELITSQGDKGHIVSGRAKIYHAIIGLVLLLLLFVFAQFVLESFGVSIGIIKL